MATQTLTKPEQDQTADKKIQQFRELFADAPEVGKKALENVLRELKSDSSETPPPAIESAGRVGSRLGKVSELTMVVPLAPGGAKRLRAFLRLLRGNLKRGGDLVGTLQGALGGHPQLYRPDAGHPDQRGGGREFGQGQERSAASTAMNDLLRIVLEAD